MPFDHTIPPAFNDKEVRSRLSDDVMDIHVECFRNFGVLCKTWDPEYFRLPYTKLHQQIIDFIQGLLDDQLAAKKAGKFAGRKFCIIGNRGLAKSGFTLRGLGFRQLLYGQNKFMVFATNAANNSIVATDSFKNHLLTNMDIRSFFGSIKVNAVTELEDGTKTEEIFGKTMWRGSTPFAPDGFTVLPRGVGQQIRGLNVNAARPDLILCDDIDKTDWLLNDEVRKKYHDEWFPGSVEYCVSQYEAENVPWIIGVSDTCKGSNALVETLAKDPDYETLRIALCDESYKTLDPSFKSQEQLDKEVERARANGKIDVFARESMSIPIAGESTPFPTDWFKDIYYDLEDEKKFDFDPHNCISFVMMDPARTLNANSDNTAIVGATVDFKNCLVFYRRLIKDRLEQWEMIEKALDMCVELDADFLGVEYAGLHVHIEAALEEAIHRRRLYNINLSELKPQMGRGEFRGEMGGKVGRILWGLQGWFRHGCVRLSSECADIQKELELILSQGAKKDCADAAAYLRQIMEQHDFVFEPQAKQLPFGDRPDAPVFKSRTLEDCIEMQERDGRWEKVHAIMNSTELMLQESHYGL
jgi:hypothetical protein